MAPKKGEEGAQPARLRALRVVYADCAGLRRCRVLPRAEGAGPLPRVGLTKGCMGQGVHMDAVLPDSGLSATGEAALTPDAAALVERLPWWPAHSMAPGDLLEKDGAWH
jgi:hypothetical protein